MLGVVMGVPMAFLSGRVRPGEPTREEALGMVLLLAGCAAWLEVSGLLAAVALGMTVANLATHHEQPFLEIEDIEWLVLVVFFVLIGASLETSELKGAVPLVAGYVLLRSIGKVVGAWGGAAAVGSPPETRRWLGVALLPQAGIALGLTLEAVARFPTFAEQALPAVVLATVVFELVGTPLRHVALGRATAATKLVSTS